MGLYYISCYYSQVRQFLLSLMMFTAILFWVQKSEMCFTCPSRCRAGDPPRSATAAASTRGIRLRMRSRSRCRCVYNQSAVVLCAPVRRSGAEVERCYADGANHSTLRCTPRCALSPFECAAQHHHQMTRCRATTSSLHPLPPPLPCGRAPAAAARARSGRLDRNATASLSETRARRRSAPPLTGRS